MAVPAEYDIRLQAGDDYKITVRLLEDGSPIDTSAYSFSAQIRDYYLPQGELVESFAIDPVSGGAVLSLTAEQTKSLPRNRGIVWDVQSESPDIRTWLSGRVTVSPEVTE